MPAFSEGRLPSSAAFPRAWSPPSPYIFLSLALAIGFKSGLFNIGVEGQFYIGAFAWRGREYALRGLPAIVFLPLIILIAARWAAGLGGYPGLS